MNPHLLLSVAEGFGESPVHAVLDPTVDPEAWLRAPPSPPVVPPRVAARLRDPKLEALARGIERRAREAGLRILFPDDADYPNRLREAGDRPLSLFVRGDPRALDARLPIAIVGSRTPTPYGIDAARQLTGALARSGLAVWSGLARGLDAIAHRTCLEHGSPTVAVLAGGLDTIYPPEHHALAEAIASEGGCLVSELPPGRRARRGHFVRRNRILATATAATIVLEGSLASGALHTARFAAEAGRDVFALPGPWHSERSQGCHRLIVEGAHLIEGPEALLRDLGVTGMGSARDARDLCRSADEEAVLSALRHGPRPGDSLRREVGLDRGAFLRALLELEARGAVRRMPGDLWAIGSGPATPYRSPKGVR